MIFKSFVEMLAWGTTTKDVFTKLPNEFLDQIFADVDREDLKSLIKTHRSFKKSAQRHLFHTIHVPAQSTLAKPSITRADEAGYLPGRSDRMEWKIEQRN
jgi:hypothetical protein